MSIPNEYVTLNEIQEKRHQEQMQEAKWAKRREAQNSLDAGLEDSFPASDPVSIAQSAPDPYDKAKQ